MTGPNWRVSNVTPGAAAPWGGAAAFACLLGLEHLNGNALTVVQGDEVRAHKPRRVLHHRNYVFVETALGLDWIVDVGVDNDGMHWSTLPSFNVIQYGVTKIR